MLARECTSGALLLRVDQNLRHGTDGLPKGPHRTTDRKLSIGIHCSQATSVAIRSLLHEFLVAWSVRIARRSGDESHRH